MMVWGLSDYGRCAFGSGSHRFSHHTLNGDYKVPGRALPPSPGGASVAVRSESHPA